MALSGPRAAVFGLRQWDSFGGFMGVTLNEIAKAAGVSRGTVDRALNNRGRIQPKVAERIKRIASEMGYSVNANARALAMAGKNISFGVILQLTETPFIQEVLNGVNAAADELRQAGYRVQVSLVRGISTEEVISSMRAMYELPVQAIVLMGNNDPALRQEIAACRENGISVVTINSDVPDSDRKCFVGQDAYRCGQTAGCVMGDLLNGEGCITIFYGHDFTSHSERVRGFCDVISEKYKGIHILGQQSTGNDPGNIHSMISGCLREGRLPDGIYFCSEGVEELCQALRESGKASQIRTVVHDIAGCRTEDILDRTIDYVIDDDGFGQGYLALRLLHHWFYYQREPSEEFFYSDIKILNAYNLSSVTNLSLLTV